MVITAGVEGQRWTFPGRNRVKKILNQYFVLKLDIFSLEHEIWNYAQI
jgi:hypothetical protein